MSNTMIGRHNVGVQRVKTGKTRSGQSEPASNKGGGITGVARSSPSRMMQPKPGVQANQAKTSLDLTRRIQGRAPEPFSNKGLAATAPTPSSPRDAKPGGESVANPRGVYAGKSGNTVGARALPGGSAVGYSKLPNQKFQIGGRMGFPPPARKAGAQNLSKVKRGSAFFGDS